MGDVEDEISGFMSPEQWKKNTDELQKWLDERLDSIYSSESTGINWFIKKLRGGIRE